MVAVAQRYVAFDTEIGLIIPGLLAPPLVCLSYCEEDSDKCGLHDYTSGLGFLQEWLLDPDVILIGHNVAYDFAVCAAEGPFLLPLIFEAYEANRVRDTMVRAKLQAIARGDYKQLAMYKRKGQPGAFSLAGLARSLLGRTMDKTTWRTGYGKLRDVPLNKWPEGARQYAMDDARATWEVFEAQGTKKDDELSTLADEPFQCRAAFALHLANVWGLRANPEWTERMVQWLTAEDAQYKKMLKSRGILREDGTRDTHELQRLVLAAYENPPLTKTNKISTSADTLRESGDEFLEELADGGKAGKIISTFLPPIQQACVRPLNARFNVLVDTGRTSSSQPNLQNIPTREGVRECFWPRPGNAFIAADYEALELRTLAQTLYDLFGDNALRDYLLKGMDLHVLFASRMLNMSYEDAWAEHKAGTGLLRVYRRMTKGPNFGLPGGMGPNKLILYCRQNHGVRIPLDSYTDSQGQYHFGARELREVWRRLYPEIPGPYFDAISRKTERGEVLQCGQRTTRLRGGCSFTEACNTLFQSPAADGAKRALWAVTRACHERSSPLWGFRVVNFVHDEIMAEGPEDAAPDAAKELSRLMVAGMQEICPDVPIKAEPVAMAYWSKQAKGADKVWRGLLGPERDAA